MKEKKKVQTENQERIKTPFSEMVRKFKKQKNAVVALCFIIFLIFLAFFGSKIVPYGINEYDYNAILQGPSMKHLFGSNILGWVMAFLQIPDAVAAALLSLTSNKYIILLIMNVILLVSGTFMDVTPAILIFTPLFLPICQSFGMSTIHFGLILVYNLCIGNITPPVGNALFVGIKVGRTSLSKVMPYMLMYYVAIIGGLLLVTFIPAVSTALPQAMGLM